MKSILLAAGLTLAASTAALAQSSPTDFTAMAASGGMFEIETSRVLLDSGTQNAEVRAHAEKMIGDHEKALGELRMSAEKSGIAMPAELDSKAATRLANLKKETGDKTEMYVTLQRLGHNEAVVSHRAYIANGTDANLRAQAEKSLPVLEEHARHIDMIAEEMMASN